MQGAVHKVMRIDFLGDILCCKKMFWSFTGSTRLDSFGQEFEKEKLTLQTLIFWWKYEIKFLLKLNKFVLIFSDFWVEICFQNVCHFNEIPVCILFYNRKCKFQTKM